MMNPLLLLALVLSLGLFPAATKISAAAAAPAKKPTPNLQPNPRKLNPPPGVVVPAAVKAELTAELELLGKEIEHARGQLHRHPEMHAFLPDAQIYYNAVRYALDDDIFTSTNQFSSARNLLKQGRERAKQLAARQAPWNTKTGLLALKKEIEAKASGKNAGPLTHVPVVRGSRRPLHAPHRPHRTS